MSEKEDQFREQLRATFRAEAQDHLHAIGAGLLALERNPAAGERQRVVESVFRAAHSLKGAARAVNFGEIESICQSLEDDFAAWKQRGSAPSSAELDRLHRQLNAMTAALASSGAPGRTGAGVVQGAADSTRPAAVSQDDTVRISAAKLDARLLAAEEMVAVKVAAHQRVEELRELAARVAAWRKEYGAADAEARVLRQVLGRAESRRFAGLSAVLDFLDWNSDSLKALELRVAALVRAEEQDLHAAGKLVDDLLEDSKKLLMLPFSTLSAPFPKLVRDLCRDQGKDADLEISGEGTEIDKRILEEMKDPLIHILRNCVDHGIETPELRRRSGKPPRGRIAIDVSRVNGSQVELAVSDDGAGIDVGKVTESAIRQGVISPEEARQLGEADALQLIFRSDVSSSPAVTRLSGRGLGLAIVRENAEKLGGRVGVESRRHAGATVRIRLPVTLATFRGILVEAAGRIFVVPTAQVERVARVSSDTIQTVEGRETIALNGRALPLVRLADVLELPDAARKTAAAAHGPVLVLGAGEQRIALAVDAVRDEREVLVKRPGKPLMRVRNVAGATVLGSGELAPVLNVNDLLQSARNAGGARRPVAAAAEPTAAPGKSILVVEDSITSRMLLKGILEAAGYEVRTAVDGVEAYAALRAERFDLVVSDVEMPRMNGIDLTAKIRADQRLAELPVVLVTALESREDRERGIDAGASAYIVKSSFDQGGLLDAVRRLIGTGR